MLNVNDNLSFKAKLVTKINGRDNVMKKISQSFMEKSEGVKGSLLIERGKGEFKETIVCSLGNVKNSPEYYIGDYDKFLSQEPKDVTKNMVDGIGERLYKVFQILRKEHVFNKEQKKLDEQLRHIKSTIAGNKGILQSLKSNKKDSDFVKVYENLVKSNEARMNTLVQKKQNLKSKLVEDGRKIAGKDDSVMNEYVDILSEVY